MERAPRQRTEGQPIVDAFTMLPWLRPTPKTYAPLALAELAPVRTAAANYHLRWHSAPPPNLQTLPPRGSIETTVKMRPGSIIWGLSASSTQQAAVQLTESQSREPFFGQPLDMRNAAGTGQRVHILARYRQVLHPGLVNVQIYNLSNVQNEVELVLWVAEP